MLKRHLATVIAVSVLMATPSFAQSTPAGVPRLSKIFVGIAVGPTSSDAASRMRLVNETGSHMWLVEGGVALSERLGFGIEYSRPSAVSGSTTVGVGRAQIVFRQQEHVTVGLVRARLFGSRYVSLDAVGGAGLLVHRHLTGSCEPPRPQCDDTGGPSLYGKAPAFVVGADMPFEIVRHVAFVVQPRLYMLRRGDSPTDPSVRSQFEYHSSTRFAVGVGGRVMW